MKLIILLSSTFIFGLVNCTIVLPPISVTGTKTAIEKQIIGDQTELEKDVWMISSAKTSSTVELKDSRERASREQGIQEENSYTYKGFAIMEVLDSEFKELKKDGVAGENNQGLLSNVLVQKGNLLPDDIREKYNPKSNPKAANLLKETIKQINLARGYIAEGYILNQKKINPEFNPDKQELIKAQREKYQSLLEKGEYYQEDNGDWVRKQ